MPFNKSQIQFWANSIFYFSLFDGLRSYLNNLSLFIDSQASQLRENQPEEFEDEQSEGEYAILMEQYDKEFPILLCNSFLIVLVSTLERELSTFCSTLAKVNNIELKSSELKGSFHEQFKVYISRVAKLQFDFNSSLWNDIKGLIEVRNAIVHNAGFVDDSPRGRSIRNLNERYPTLDIRNNIVSSTIPFCNQMIQIVYDFLKKITQSDYEHYQ